jgi:hypothetical protein
MITTASEYAPYLPPPQSAQVEAEVAPTAAENLPASQSLQTDAPAAEYLPETQSAQLEEPAVAWKLAGTWLYLPAGHDVQAAA